jgi:hypothetical protein
MNSPAPGAPSGYQHGDYARSFADIAMPRPLERCGGWLLERATPALPLRDAMGCYPLFACTDWSGLREDLDAVSGELVSLVLVADPFGPRDAQALSACFDDVVEFKPHYVADLDETPVRPLPRKHRRNVERALERLQLEVCARPLDHLDEWVALYRGLEERHGITGVRSFSRDCLRLQMGVPGLVMFRAVLDGATVGLHQWMVHGGVAYGHLGATSAAGYAGHASYALYWQAREYFRGRVRWLDLGATPGAAASAEHGLARFKRGWATGTRPAWLCTRVFDRDRYNALCAATSAPAEPRYFPAYRSGDFR